MNYKYYTIVILGLLAFSACEKDDIDIPATDNEVNQWSEQTMRENYLWYSSSSTLGLISVHTVFSIKLTNQIIMKVLLILNAVWNAARLKDTATAGSLTFITWVTNHETAFVKG